MILKYVHWFLALMFFLFAVVQLNDPDPLIWLIVYGSMMVVSLMASFNRYPTKIMIVMSGGFLIMSVVYFDGFKEWLGSSDLSLLFEEWAKMQFAYIEEAREFLGLLVCLLVLLLYFYLSRRQEAH